MNSVILLLILVAALLAGATLLLVLSRPEPDRVPVRRLAPPAAAPRR